MYQEIAILKKLDHVNVVKLIEVGGGVLELGWVRWVLSLPGCREQVDEALEAEHRWMEQWGYCGSPGWSRVFLF